MAQLRMALTIRFIGPRRFSGQGNAEFRKIQREARTAGRRALGRIRPKVRAAAPKRTRRMAQSFQVRNAARTVPGGITSELKTSGAARLFYASFTNSENRSSRGWFDKAQVTGLEAELGGQLGNEINNFGRRYAAIAGRQVVRDLQKRLLRTLGKAFIATSSAVIAASLTGRGIPRQRVTFRQVDDGE